LARGIGAFGALRVPEEDNNEGTSRPSLVTGDISLNQPFEWASQSWRYNTSLRGQWSNQPLIPQDRLSIAGRYTVRGFDGEQSLSGEKGLIWRNELAWKVLASEHELYWGVDYGRATVNGQRHRPARCLVAALQLRPVCWRADRQTGKFPHLGCDHRFQHQPATLAIAAQKHS